MSDQGPMPDRTIPAPAPKPRRHVALSILMFIVGVILLLPGVCALFFASLGGLRDNSLLPLYAICFLVSAGGIALIVKTFR